MTTEDRLSIAHSIKTLETIHGSIKYWQSPEDIKSLIEHQIEQLRLLLA
jgi:hypothetical protein